MNYRFVGKNLEIPEYIKELTVSKLERLNKFLDENAEVTVSMTQHKGANEVEVTIPLDGRILRAEVESESFEHAADEVLAVLERQLKEFKSRLRDQARKDKSFREELDLYFDIPSLEQENDIDDILIERTKQFALKPMDATEAIMEMELLSHSFYMFRNAFTDEINVVYKRKNGNYGLIEPDF